ncbi:hypothetical protein RHSIM_Rhsim09G0117200 [Rhododendron simsii]|uniref:FBD domain-containing protein n=1 Tax=Rhododendron simsii TaxID=118357 RepID=A0A834GLF8_RHOSS|nr:hypothetical protein RHSIM_Rhsim09G0117200 [Rhododendron simsii]
MEITCKRRNLDTNTDGNLGLINNLPGHIIDCVLNRLPFHDVVRTSILSRKWRGYWATLQHLDLGYEFYLFVKDAVEKKLYSHGRYSRYDKYDQYEYERIISRIFMLHLGPHVKVTLYIPKFDVDEHPLPDSDQWILYLSRKNIKELTLTYKNRERHLLPRCFFSCRNLTHLELRNIVLEPPLNFEGFRNLIAIQCTGVKFKVSMFESLMYASPLLQKLVFVDCSGLNHFKVSAPNLEILHFEDNHKFETIDFEIVPKLADVTISTLYREVDHFARSSHLLEFLTSLPKVTRLSLNGDFLRFLAGDTLPQQLPTTVVEGLKYLELNSLDFANFDEVSCALCLIRSTPNLKQLEIQARTTREDTLAPKWGYMEVEAPFGCNLDGLRVVKMKLIRGFKPELELVQFLLANSPFLEKMSIDWSLYTEHSQTQQKLILDMAKELIRCYRAISPTVNLYIPKFGSGIDRFLDTDQWILHLSRENIKELTLNYEQHQTLFLPHCFYSCLDLTCLELRNLGLLPPQDFKGFRNLLELKLTRVAFMDYKFESLIHGSPLLQKLIFVNCSGVDHFKVSAPKLEIFQLHANFEFKTICFENVPKLSDVTINSTLDTLVDDAAKSSPLLEFLASLPKLTRLSANGKFLKFLAADSLPQELPPTIGGLKHLKLNNLDFVGKINTPNLKELEIQASTTRLADAPPPPKWGYMEAEATFGCTLNRLRVVKIELIEGFQPELELIQFLLANSPFLEKMYIDPVYSEVKNKVALDMAIELLRYYRASPRVDFRYLILRDI